jgi:hypothetical protein
MISWVNAVCKEWGRAQYWLLFGKGGFPTRTILGKLMEEGVVGAACSQFTMEYPEVLTGDNLVVANAIKTLSEVPRSVVTVHYVFRMPTRLKYAKLGMGRTSYYDTLNLSHVQLANAIDAIDSKNSGQNRQKLSGTLQGPWCMV